LYILKSIVTLQIDH